jgi:preprotein translocase subunit YajC
MVNPDVVLLVLLLAVWYFAWLQPQLREQKAHETLLGSLAKDDRIVTASGLHGRVVKVEEKVVVIEVAKGTQVTVDKQSIARRESDPGEKK